eukprot:5646473-Amphidinium_carterae.1
MKEIYTSPEFVMRVLPLAAPVPARPAPVAVPPPAANGSAKATRDRKRANPPSQQCGSKKAPRVSMPKALISCFAFRGDHQLICFEWNLAEGCPSGKGVPWLTY